MELYKSKFKIFSIIISILLSQSLLAQNRLNSRIFYQLPKLYNSPSHFNWSKLYPILIATPVDNRGEFFGETAFKKTKIQYYNDFWKQSIINEIQEKIIKDLHLNTFDQNQISTKSKVLIYPTLEVFYPDIRGFIWVKSFAKVRIRFKVVDRDNQILLDKKYEAFYISAGTDSEWEGKMAETIENGANITIGIALRKALDDFYQDLGSLL